MNRLFLIFITLLIFPCLKAQEDIDILMKQLNSAVSSGDSISVARIYYKLGKEYDRQDSLEKSNFYLEKALSVAKELKYSKAIATITNYLAGNYSELGRQKEAIRLYDDSFSLFMSLKDTASAAAICMNLGSEYLNMSDYDKALEYELKALKLKESARDSANIAYYYQSVSEIYKSLGFDEKWKEYLFKAKELSGNPVYADLKTRMAVLNDIAALKEKEGNKDLALKLYDQMYSVSEKENYTRGMNTALTNMSNIYLKQGNYNKAVEAAKRSYMLSLSEDNLWAIVNRCLHIGNIYLKMRDGTNAQIWFNRVLQKAGNRYPDEIMKSYKGLYEADKLTGDYKNATQHVEKYIALKDSIEDVVVKNRVRELEAIYQNEKSKSKIKELFHETKIQKQKIRLQNLLLLSVILIALGILAMVFMLLRQQKLKALNREVMLQQRLLRSQMNPHFIFNSLGSIQNFMYNNETKKAAFYLGSFSSLMRSILENSRKELITIEEETETLNNYLELQKMRLGFRYKIVCSEDIDKEFVLIPPMLIQPFVENSIKHGIKDLGEKGHIKVEFQLNGDKLKVTVEDNGVGINHGSTPDRDHKSLAMKIFKERISFLSSYLKKELTYQIFDKSETNKREKGTKVIVEIPIINNYG